MVTLGSLFGDERLSRAFEKSLVTDASGSNQVKEKI